MKTLNGIITCLVIASRPNLIFFAAMATLVALGIAGSKGRRFPPVQAFAFLFLPFFILSAWGGANWAVEEARGAGHWRSELENVMAIVSVLFVVVHSILFRRAPRSWILIPAGLFALYSVFMAWLVGVMAIANSWL